MVPLTDPSTGQLRFGQNPREKRLALIAAVGSVAGAALIYVFSSPQFVPFLATLLLAAALAGFWMAARADEVILDTRSGSWHEARGVRPFVRRRQGVIADLYRLSLEKAWTDDAFGDQRVLYSLFLDGESTRVPLFTRWDNPLAAMTAEQVASALGRSAPDEKAVTISRRPWVQLGITYGAWGAMLCAAILIIWPGKSSSRPSDLLRPPQQRFRQNAPEIDFDRGYRLYVDGDFKGAEAEFRRALKKVPGFPSYLNMLAYAEVEQGKLDDALKTALAALKGAPSDWMIIDTVAEMYQRNRQYRTAAAYYERALQQAGSFAVGETQCKYGETLLELGRKHEAVEQLQRAAGTYERRWAIRAQRVLQRIGVEVKPVMPSGPMAAPLQQSTPGPGREIGP